MLTTMDSVPEQFRILKELWYPILWNYANDLFLVLATIEVGLAALLWVMQSEGVESIGAGLLRKFLWLGFMYAILYHADTWIPAIIRSFAVAGQQAARIETLNPGEVFTAGLGVGVKMLWELVGWGIVWNAPGTVVGILAALLVIFAFGVIAIEMATTLIENYLLTGAGVFVLGFAAFRGTASISERYLSFTIGIGLKLLVIYLLVGAGTTLAPAWIALINSTSMFDFYTPFTIAFAAVLYATVAMRISRLAASLASGNVSMSFHDVLGAATTATHAAGTVGRAAGTGIVGGQVAGAAARLGVANAHQAGGGVLGAIKGGFQTASQVGSEAARAAVPGLNRV
jgi:type IV secretion system protein TrbL